MNTGDSKTEKPVVLVAVADPAARTRAWEVFEKSGWYLEIAGDGTSALQVFKKIQPDLVLLDAGLAGIDGYGVCAEIRKLPQGKHTAVLMLTGPEISQAERSYDAGASDFIIKPIERDFLGHRVRHILREIGSRRATPHPGNEVDRAFVNASPHLLLYVRKDGTIMGCRSPENFNNLLSPDGLRGKKINEILFREAPNVVERYLEQVLQTGEKQITEHKIRKGSEVYFYESCIIPGGENDLVAIVRDVTEQKKVEQKITRLAFYDALTGLLNRHSFKEHLVEAIAQADHSGRLLALLHIDLDHFKRINRSLGPATGDTLLQRVADRIIQCARKNDCKARFGQDPSAKVVARMEGDEFFVLLSEIAHIRDVAAVARLLLDEISRPFVLDEREIFVTASIGISIYPSDGKDVCTLLKNVEEATCRAKEQGRNNFQFCTVTKSSGEMVRLGLESDLRKALDRGELLIYYQPQVDLRTGRIVGAEALLRWEHPELGFVSPAEFIPAAEETGLILPIGRWVLAVACMQNNIWRQSGFAPIRVSVNISAQQFRQKNLLETIGKALKNSALDPHLLELEITESTVMQDAASTILVLREIKKMGLRLAIDDFGTGYSSLSYLKRFPLDVLKIDISFINEITTDPGDAAITKAIIRMAHSLNLEAIAEGVETEEQLGLLRENECDLVQGYVFSRPLPPVMMTRLLEETKRNLRIASNDGS